MCARADGGGERFARVHHLIGCCVTALGRAHKKTAALGHARTSDTDAILFLKNQTESGGRLKKKAPTF